jgi:TonB family protein
MDGTMNRPAEGAVHVGMIIGIDGETSSFSVTRTTNSQFNAAAMAVMRVMRFSPGTVGGVAVPVRVELPVTFRPGS